MSPSDLICSRDGSLSLTKLAACTGHLLIAVAVAWITFVTRQFNIEMWALYMGIAVCHATYDKTLASIVSLKNRQLDQQVSDPGAGEPYGPTAGNQQGAPAQSQPQPGA